MNKLILLLVKRIQKREQKLDFEGKYNYFNNSFKRNQFIHLPYGFEFDLKSRKKRKKTQKPCFSFSGLNLFI